MKTPFLLAFVVCLALAGCIAPTSPETSAIVRHIKSTQVGTRAALTKAAEARGYHELSRDLFQKAVMRQRDPVLGLIPVDGKPPQIALAFRVNYQSNETGTLVTIAPVAQFKKLGSDEYRERVLPLNSPDRAAIVDMIDRVASELEYSKF